MKKETLDPGSLDLVMQENEFVVYYRDKPLLTAKGNRLSHPSERLLQNIVADLQVGGPPGEEEGIGFLRLLEFRKDFIDEGNDLIARGFDRILASDAFVRMKTGRKEDGAQDKERLAGTDGKLIQAVFWTFSIVIRSLNAFLQENIRNLETEAEADHPFIAVLRKEYLAQTPEVRTVINLLSGSHRSGVVLPFLFATGRISASEYARSCISVGIRNTSSGDGSNPVPEFPYPELKKKEDRGDAAARYQLYFREATVAGDFLYFHTGSGNTGIPVLQQIKRGEGADLEFKSTLRWDLKAGKTNAHVERACLKTICAFLNSDGGTLLIGIRDDGSAEGIESDRFANEDKFLLHLWTLIRTCLGRDVSPYIRTSLEKLDQRTICLVRCQSVARPVFLRQPGFDEEFFIRLGPSTSSLDISEALKYIEDRGRKTEDGK
ncbi:MAG TPA: ATP-binding protein [Bacteroidales bacterium]|nr:ATP-binding protein [Bacteroidales bacterium]